MSLSYLPVVSSPNVSISRGLDYINQALGPSLPASRWVVLANTTFLVRFLTMSSKAGQKYPSLHLGQAILQCRVVNIKVVGTWEGQKQSCKKLVIRELVMQTLRPQFRSLHSGSPSTAEAEAGGFLRLDGQRV